jgi:hypothetical protein
MQDYERLTKIDPTNTVIISKTLVPQDFYTGMELTITLVENVTHPTLHAYRASQEECEILRESVPYVKLHRYNPKNLYPNLNGYEDNDQRILKI